MMEDFIQVLQINSKPQALLPAGHCAQLPGIGPELFETLAGKFYSGKDIFIMI